MVVVTVTTAGLSASTIGAKEPPGAMMPAGSAAEATVADVLKAKGNAPAPTMIAAPTMAAVRCLRRREGMAKSLARSLAVWRPVHIGDEL
jgi:hypothetical protein